MRDIFTAPPPAFYGREERQIVVLLFYKEVLLFIDYYSPIDHLPHTTITEIILIFLINLAETK